MLIDRGKIKDISENLPENDKALLKEHLLFILNNMPPKSSLVSISGYSKKEMLNGYGRDLIERTEMVNNLTFWNKGRKKVYFDGSGEEESFVEAVYVLNKKIGLKENIRHSLLDLCERWSSIFPQEFYKAILRYFPEDIDTYIFGKRTGFMSLIPLKEFKNIRTLFDFFVNNEKKLKRDLKTSIVDYHKAFPKQFQGLEKTLLWKELILNNVEDGESLSYIWNDRVGGLENEQYLTFDSDIFQFNLDPESFLVSVGGTLKKSFLNTKLQKYMDDFIHIKKGNMGRLNEKYQLQEVKVIYLSTRKKISFLLVLKEGANKTFDEVKNNLMEMLDIFKVLEKEIVDKLTMKTKEPGFYIEQAINLINTKDFNSELIEVINANVHNSIEDEDCDLQDFKL